MVDSKHLHILGIGGHAMRGIALAVRELGYEVTGTDQGAYPPGSDWLDEHGFTWWKKPAISHLEGVDEVILGGGIQPDDPELLAAQQQGLPIRSYPELVAELTGSARRIVVAGTHGKTTTTSLLAWIFETAGHHPDYLIGIKPHNFDFSVRLAGSKIAIIEGDEYRASQIDTQSKFAYYRPDVLVLTSIEMDHPDFFKNLEDITKRFKALVKEVPKKGGRLIYYAGDQNVSKVVTGAAAAAESYGTDQADWSATDVSFVPEGVRFTAVHRSKPVGPFQVPLYGAHNVQNALAAIAVAFGEGIAAEVVQQALETFTGATRRFTLLTQPGDSVTVIDDYAHHPSEVAATIHAAADHFPGRVVAVYKPHTYSRTKELLKDYHQSFEDAGRVFITEIESAREAAKKRAVSGADVAKGVGKKARYVADRKQLLDAVLKETQPGDVVLCMSVNGNDQFAEELAAKVGERG